MPRYFFDVDVGETMKRDDHGVEFDDPAEASKAAVGLLPDLARGEAPADRDWILSSTVRDDGGCAFFRATLSLKAEWLES